MTVYLALLWAAFWVAVRGFRRACGPAPHRFVAGLALGAVCARIGWAIQHVTAVVDRPAALLDPSAGYSVLFVPIGAIAAAPWGAPRDRRLRFLAASLASLPAALATARVACLVAGCCQGPRSFPAAPALVEIAGLLVLHGCLQRGGEGADARRVIGTALFGIGLVRLVVEPWRIAPPLGPPSIPVSVLALGWMAAGALCGRSADLLTPAPPARRLPCRATRGASSRSA